MSASPLTHLFQEDIYQVPSPITLVMSKPWNQYQPEEKVLLGKILGSVKLDLASVRIVQRAKLTMAELQSLNAPRVLVFGSDVGEIKPYEHNQAQGFSVIKADDLSALDDARKKSLWIALRSMFGI